jgi:glyoxylase-like metal-dependent hydrolase (beta-lactamase superfamily II)
MSWVTRAALLATCLFAAAACGTTLSTLYGSEGLTVRTLATPTANLHVVDAGGKRVLVDSGDAGTATELVAELTRQGVDPKTIDFLVVTHAHADHAGNARFFKDHYGTTIIAGRGDGQSIARGKNHKLCPRGFLAELLVSRFQGASFDPFPVDRWVEGEQPFEALGPGARLLQVGGHTSGSLVLVVGDKAFVGDLVRGGVFAPSEPTRHLYVCDLEANRGALERVLAVAGVTEWFTGHFGPLQAEAVRQALPDL